MIQWDFQNKGNSGWTGTSSFVFEVLLILVPIALFSSLSRWGLGTRIDSLAKAPPAKRCEKGYGDENEVLLRYLRPSIIYSPPCDQIVQRAYSLGQNVVCMENVLVH